MKNEHIPPNPYPVKPPPNMPEPRKETLEAENARLKAEVERLTALVESNLNKSKVAMANSDASVRTLEAQVERVGAENAHLHKGIYSLSLNVAQLKDEVERLTKAGDRLSAFLINCTVESRISRSYLNKLDNDWNAAKEGNAK